MKTQVARAVEERLASAPWVNPLSKTPLPPRVAEAFRALGDAQRGEPEAAVLKCQFAIGGGVLGVLLEHVGDLTHRMTFSYPQSMAGYEYVKEKVNRALRYLRNQYPFRLEHQQNMKSNAEYWLQEKGIPVADYKAKVERSLARYVAAHQALPVYNETQWAAREAAICLGKELFGGAERALEKLEAHLASPETWTKYAFEHKTDAAGNPLEYRP